MHAGVTDDSSRDGFGYYMSRVCSVRGGIRCKMCAALSSVPSLRAVSLLGVSILPDG